AGVWNLQPSMHHDQLAWIQKFLADTTISNIYFFNGQTIENITDINATKNLHPILKDGQIVWLQTEGSVNRVKLFDGDSVRTLVEDEPGVLISGFDLSNGISVASLTNFSTNETEIKIYNSETNSFTIVNDTARIFSLHIDNGLVCWNSGSGVIKKLMLYNIYSGILEEWGSAVNPVVDDEQVAWTLGESIDFMTPVNYLQLSTGNENGLPQSLFKYNDGLKAIWGNLDNSTTARLFFSDGNSTVQLTDSSVYKDFIMLNDGYAIWRHDFTSLYLYDGINPPELLVDSLQCERMYLADGSIGFHGFRVDAGNNVNQSWIYRINTSELIQLTFDNANTTTNTFTLVDGNYACWYRDSSNITMLMLYDGVSKTRLTEFPVNNEFGFVEGKIVWSESLNNVFQIMIYDVNTHIKNQITNSVNDKYRPITDGSKVVWFENDPTGTIMWYYDIVLDKAYKVAHILPPVARWLWLSNGKIAWTSNGEVCVYDGNVISKMTSSAPFNPNLEPYVDDEIVVWNKNNPDPNSNRYGQIFRGKLRSHVSFDAENIAGSSPLTTTFKNNSFQGVQTYFWDFGDGQTSTEKNPVHIYQNPGVYTVTLTVSGPAGSSSEKKIKLIRASLPSSVNDDNDIPGEFLLYQNYPNPFNPSTNIKFDLPEESNVSLKIYNVLGEEIVTILNETLKAGSHSVQWNARNLSSGIYFYKIESDKFTSARSLMLLR
ncbi:MAG: PKD domain-containing protein, partial [Nitrososphaerales archaeon]